MSKIRAYLSLMRPPNLLTAVSDVVAGFTAVLAFSLSNSVPSWDWVPPQLEVIQLVYLALASILLYAGGVVLNDYFDADIDAIERPERPIPSGRVPRKNAAILGFSCLLAGVVLPFMNHWVSGAVAAGIACLAVLYDAAAKHHSFWGPLNMGLCRGANLALGMSAFPALMLDSVFLAIIPITYVAAITLVSRGEVHGTSKANFNFALILYLLAMSMVLSLGFLDEFRMLRSLPFLAIFLLVVFPALIKARNSNSPDLIGASVKSGVLGLIVLNAALAAGFAGWIFAIMLLLLLPVSGLLAKQFAVS